MREYSKIRNFVTYQIDFFMTCQQQKKSKYMLTLYSGTSGSSVFVTGDGDGEWAGSWITFEVARGFSFGCSTSEALSWFSSSTSFTTPSLSLIGFFPSNLGFSDAASDLVSSSSGSLFSGLACFLSFLAFLSFFLLSSAESDCSPVNKKYFDYQMEKLVKSQFAFARCYNLTIFLTNWTHFWIVDLPGGGGGVPSSPGGGVIVLDLREGLIGGVLGPLGGGGALLSILWGWGDASL